MAVLLVAVLLAGCADDGPSGDVNELMTGAVIISSEVGPGQGVRTVIDGDLSTGWEGPEVPYWFEVDLGSQVMIEEVRLLPGRTVSATVRVHVGVHDNPGRQPGGVVSMVTGEWEEIPVGYEARFIRVWVDEAGGATNWLELEAVVD